MPSVVLGGMRPGGDSNPRVESGLSPGIDCQEFYLQPFRLEIEAQGPTIMVCASLETGAHM